MNRAVPWSGLSRADARAALEQHGPNEIEDRENRGLLDIVKGVAAEPMFLLLLGAATIYLVLGDLAEGLLLAAFAGLTVGLVMVQERRSARALDALRSLSAPQARVIRDGVIQTIAAREIVPGDLIVLNEGERVAADAQLLEASGMSVDESLLTGESVPVRKICALPSAPTLRPGGDDSPLVYAGTLLVAGHGIAQVLHTGRHTQAGRIGASLAAIDLVRTPMQIQLRRLVRLFGSIALGASLLLVLWYGLVRGDWVAGLLSAIALGMAMLPEEFPMALTVFLALGAWRLARIQVLTRRPAVVEALGAATLLCVDKTGTLTHNRMSLRTLVGDGSHVDLLTAQSVPDALHPLLEYALLASRRASSDPMDRAIIDCADRLLAQTPHLHPQAVLQQEHPLTPALLAISQVWLDPSGHRRIAAKGAPEAVADLCHLDAVARQAMLEQVRTLAEQGLRVLAVAEGASETGDLHDNVHDYRFTLLGLIAFDDPLRENVPASVALARRAGISVAMITGDYPATARAVALSAGIDLSAGVLSGDDLDALDDRGLEAALGQVRVFARVRPEQKLRLVEAFQRRGETVAMTGDGVNDAPALKAAHIGIAMGERGTDVAREAAGIVLLDSDFTRIVAAVRMGRRIFDNLRRVMTYITAIHVPIAGLALLPLLMGLPPVMLPAHVVLTEMVIDPICSIAFEQAPEDPQIMDRPPRRADETLVGRSVLWQGLLQGSVLLAITLAIDLAAIHSGRDAESARTLVIVGLTAGNLILVALNLTAGVGWRGLLKAEARTYWWVSAAAALALGFALVSPGARELLGFGVPRAGELALTLGSVGAMMALGAALGRWLFRDTGRAKPSTL